MFADENGDCFGSYQDQLYEAQARICRLEEAIQNHHEQTTENQMCWENDVELWETIGIKSEHPAPPPWCEFMIKCAEYRASREKKK